MSKTNRRTLLKGAGAAAGAAEEDMFKTLAEPKGKLKDVQLILARAREQGRDPGHLTDEERQQIRQLLGE